MICSHCVAYTTAFEHVGAGIRKAASGTDSDHARSLAQRRRKHSWTRRQLALFASLLYSFRLVSADVARRQHSQGMFLDEMRSSYSAHNSNIM